MKKLSFFFFTVFSFFIVLPIFAQVEVKGTGNTSATKTWFTSNTNPDTTMIVLDDGNVGIGTTSPTTKLDVNGRITTSVGVVFPDATLQTTAYTGSAVAYQNVFTVATSGGDFTTITAALGACVAPSAVNGYLIRVMPGVYVENVNCLSYVHLKGGGKYSTVIDGFVTGADNSIIEGFTIKKGVLCQNVSPTIIHNIITTSPDGGATDGIEVKMDGKPWIVENEITGCAGIGIYVHDSLSNPWIFGNKVLNNGNGGIKVEEASPSISNNIIFDNSLFGIKLSGNEAHPSGPTIDDNIIGSSDYTTGGIGIHMTGYALPRIIANDIRKCEFGIWIDSPSQPSIIGNNISYNFEAGIYCASNGTSQGTNSVVIKSNHIYRNVQQGAVSHMAGIYIFDSSPEISHNNIQDNVNGISGASDINYVNCTANFPVISLNVYDVIIRASSSASGLYNVTSNGVSILP